ncbi:MAG: hypothetical protein AB1445_07835 [Bacillota bacterium]
MANNGRLLLLPWAHLPHVVSHVLARSMQALPAHWQAKYGHPLLLLETFVDPRHFAAPSTGPPTGSISARPRGLPGMDRATTTTVNPRRCTYTPCEPDFRDVIGCQHFLSSTLPASKMAVVRKFAICLCCASTISMRSQSLNLVANLAYPRYV